MSRTRSIYDILQEWYENQEVHEGTYEVASTACLLHVGLLWYLYVRIWKNLFVVCVTSGYVMSQVQLRSVSRTCIGKSNMKIFVNWVWAIRKGGKHAQVGAIKIDWSIEKMNLFVVDFFDKEMYQK